MQYKNTKKNRVLGIVGSPRHGGNTDLLVDEVLKGAKECGAETEKIFLKDLIINPCDGCNSCFKSQNNICKHNDDFENVRKQMEASQTWIIGTPVYWWGPTAILKAFIDRWYQQDMARDFFRNKNMVLVIASGGASGSYSRHIVGMIEDITSYLGISLKEKIICAGVSRRGDVKNRPEILEQALNAGRNLNRNL